VARAKSKDIAKPPSAAAETEAHVAPVKGVVSPASGQPPARAVAKVKDPGTKVPPPSAISSAQERYANSPQA
jgi:hypothetical protein